MPQTGAVVLEPLKSVRLHFEHCLIRFLRVCILAHFELASCYLSLYPCGSHLELWQLLKLFDCISAVIVRHQLHRVANLSQERDEISTFSHRWLHSCLLYLEEVSSNALGSGGILALAALGITVVGCSDKILVDVVGGADREGLHNRVSDDVLLVEEALVWKLWVLSGSVRRVDASFLLDSVTVTKASSHCGVLLFGWRVKLKLIGLSKPVDHSYSA